MDAKGSGAADADHGSGSGSGHVDARPADAMLDAFVPDSPPAGPTLKIKNYLNWCTISIDGGAFAASASYTVSVTANATVPLVAKAKNDMFEIAPNMWHGTTGDSGAGDTGVVAGTDVDATSTTGALTNAGTKCVWVCCPFSPGGNGCPTANQCP